MEAWKLLKWILKCFHRKASSFQFLLKEAQNSAEALMNKNTFPDTTKVFFVEFVFSKFFGSYSVRSSKTLFLDKKRAWLDNMVKSSKYQNWYLNV